MSNANELNAVSANAVKEVFSVRYDNESPHIHIVAKFAGTTAT